MNHAEQIAELIGALDYLHTLILDEWESAREEDALNGSYSTKGEHEQRVMRDMIAAARHGREIIKGGLPQ